MPCNHLSAPFSISPATIFHLNSFLEFSSCSEKFDFLIGLQFWGERAGA